MDSVLFGGANPIQVMSTALVLVMVISCLNYQAISLSPSINYVDVVSLRELRKSYLDSGEVAGPRGGWPGPAFPGTNTN